MLKLIRDTLPPFKGKQHGRGVTMLVRLSRLLLALELNQFTPLFVSFRFFLCKRWGLMTASDRFVVLSLEVWNNMSV